RIEDAFGNLRTNDNATVVTAARNAGSGILQGTTARTAAGGVIAYSGLFHTVATNITIDFTSPGLTLATSTGIAISPTTADRFVFAVEPANGVAGSVFGTQPVVKSKDQFGNDSTVGLGTSRIVTVSLVAGSGPLQGTTALNIGTTGGNGTVAYTNLRIDVAGTDKQLQAASIGFVSATSAIFTVVPGPANRLAMQTQPSATAIAGVPFAQQPAVRVEDAFGNLRSDSGTTITASRGNGSGTLQGTLSASTTSGVATFANLSHNVATNITINFASAGLTGTNSSTVAVSAAGADHLALVQGD